MMILQIDKLVNFEELDSAPLTHLKLLGAHGWGGQENILGQMPSCGFATECKGLESSPYLRVSFPLTSTE